MTTAQVPGSDQSEDRILLGPDVVIMLDGASAFAPTEVTAQTYVDTLGTALLEDVAGRPDVELVDALARAIDLTASKLSLSAGTAPSSTVAIARAKPLSVEVLVLGDTQVVAPGCLVRDERLKQIGRAEREAYQARLRDGHGYDAKHRSLLLELQMQQQRYRNREGGYWIAEADPAAAKHALVRALDVPATPWLVLSTDGAYRPMGELDLDDWARLAGRSQGHLTDILNRCQQWESDIDPDGMRQPRAKRHDDKSIAVMNLDA